MRVPELGGHGCDAAWADDFHHALRVAADRRDRAAGTASSTRSRCWPRRSGARTCTTAPTRTFRKRRFGAPADDVPPERFVVFSADHDQVGNRALGDRLPVDDAAARGVLHAPVTLHAHAVPGRGVRRAGAVSVLLRSHRPRDRRRDPRGPPARVRRRSPSSAATEVPDPQDVATFERSKLTREGEPEGLRELHARAAARPPRAAAARRRRRRRLRRARRLAGRAPRRVHAAGQLRPRRRSTCRASAPRRSCWPRTSRRSSPASSSSPALSGALVR